MRTEAQAVVIGASAGAVEALSYLLPGLPEDFPLPVIIVVHIPSEKKNIFAEIYEPRCRLRIFEAEDKQPVKKGEVYFAPPDYHLLVEKDNILSLSNEEPVLYSRPSIDILFESAADAYGPGLIGIILTGTNNDGAAGLKEVSDMGGTVIVVKPVEEYNSAMPKAAIAACPHAKILSLEEILEYLQEIKP
jgi:two-component system chemotaxis response regulator CheB